VVLAGLPQGLLPKVNDLRAGPRQLAEHRMQQLAGLRVAVRQVPRALDAPVEAVRALRSWSSRPR
jgi:hypothetical protein